MSIIRIKKEREYVSIANTILQNKTLTWEARGIMAYLLSKPDGWECRNYDLVNQGPAGRHIVQRILKELQEAGYIHRYQKSDGHKIEWVTEIYETPELNTTSRNTNILHADEPTGRNSTCREPGDIVSTDSQQVLTPENTNISPSAENEPHEQSSGDFGEPTNGDEPIIEPEDNETIPPGEVDVILRKGGHDPDEVGARMKSVAEQALAKVEISGPPENDYVPDSCTCAALAASGAMPPCSYCENLPLEPGSALTDTLDREIMGGKVPDGTTVILDHNDQREVFIEEETLDTNDNFADLFGTEKEKLIRPSLTEAEVAHLRTFGHLPADKAPQVFDTIQEIKNAGWEIWDPTVEQGIAHYLEAVRAKRSGFAIPNNGSVRKDWYKDIAGHLQDYQPDDLGTLYRLAVDKLEKAGMSYTRPGSLTKTLPDVVNEPTQKTIVDKDGGFYV